MRPKLLFITLTLLAVTLPALAQDTRFYTPPVVGVPKVDKAPKIDGVIEPGEWAQAVSLSPFVLLGGQGQPVNATNVWVMYDDHNLYIAALLQDPNPAQLKSTVVDRDGPVNQDDSFEMLFDTDNQQKSYIHLVVNPHETQYDSLMDDKSADYRWTARCATLADGWSVEFELPFANDVPPAKGASWGFSAARHSTTSGEYSAWTRNLKLFEEIANFGTLTFSDRPLSLEIGTLGSLWLGTNTAQVVVRNPGLTAATVKVNARVLGRDKHGSFLGSTKVNLASGARQTENVPYQVYEDGFSTVVFSLSDATSTTVWRSAPYAIVTPEVAPQIAAAERTLATATRSWMKLSAGENKKTLQADLDGLTGQWRYLVAQYRSRTKLAKADLEALSVFASRLQTDTEELQKRIEVSRASE